MEKKSPTGGRFRIQTFQGTFCCLCLEIFYAGGGSHPNPKFLRNFFAWVWTKMPKNNPEYSKILKKNSQMMPNAPKCSKMIQDAPKLLQKVLKRSNMLLNAFKISNAPTRSKMLKNAPKMLPKRSKMLQKGPKCSNTVQHYVAPSPTLGWNLDRADTIQAALCPP